MRFFRGTVILSLIGVLFFCVYAQESKKNSSSKESPTDKKILKQDDVICKEDPHLRCVDLCKVADKITAGNEVKKDRSLHPGNTPQPKGMDITIQDRKSRKMKTFWLPNHGGEIDLSHDGGDKVGFYCRQGNSIQINDFAPADVGSYTAYTGPGYPDLPFGSGKTPTQFTTPIKPVIVLGPPLALAVGHGYKFTFTVQGKPPYDPHLIVKP